MSGRMLDFLAYLEFERGLSRNTLEAYRSDLLQFGAFLGRRGVDVVDVQHADLSAFLAELATGGDERAAGGGGDAAAQGRVPALVLPPPAPRGRASTTTRPPTCARRARASGCPRSSAATRSPGCSRAPSGTEPGRRCATARCSS